MFSDPAITVKNLGKQYRIYGRPVDRIREMYSLRGRTYHTDFSALTDVSFNIDAGETVGIIGPNGSGKSTLLEIICGTLTATEGTVAVRGRVSALLELGAGFNPAFSGRENVYLNAALLGITREEINHRFGDIAAFANIGDFIEHPVSTYSSGMYVRLAFATAINTDPDILIVDEALAVGDIRFQRKCFRRFQEMQEAGKTILFVTHAVDLVQAHCSRAIYLKAGRVSSLGTPKVVIQDYLEDLFGAAGDSREEACTVPDISPIRRPLVGGLESDPLPEREGAQLIEKKTGPVESWPEAPEDRCHRQASYNANEYRWGDQRAVIFDYEITDAVGHSKAVYDQGERLILTVKVFFTCALTRLIYGFTLKTVDGRVVFGANSRERRLAVADHQAGDMTSLSFEFHCALIPGEYFISLGVALDDGEKDNVAVDRRYDLIHLPILGPPGDFGVADLGLSLSEKAI